MTELHTDETASRTRPASTSWNGSGGPITPDPNQSSRRRPTRISSLHVGLITAAILLVLLVVFLIQNAHTVEIHFLGAHLRVSLAVAMLAAAVAGALITGAAGTARIAQLRRSRRTSATGGARRHPDTRQES
jgi:lipopolysaccharide assembly protein A